MAVEVIRVLLIDDHPVVRRGLRIFLASAGDMLSDAGGAASAPRGTCCARRFWIMGDAIIAILSGL